MLVLVIVVPIEVAAFWAADIIDEKNPVLAFVLVAGRGGKAPAKGSLESLVPSKREAGSGVGDSGGRVMLDNLLGPALPDLKRLWVP